ncbi:OPT-domain-containing protein [Mycena indigotica]|uniref:OPT-domain-containing protein n=1 Tax=Mycena indigotica TaxID=2126181 RepID=A0A8H6W9C9_9AGAR|nr:OPT-domain-containing protein [Mycena indigotica]KAF7303999.1 OPT-domain-containing protein [Mycena indigotica]
MASTEKDDIKAALSEKASTHSDLNEKADLVLADIAVLESDIQAVPDDILEAAEYARTMSHEEVEETIHQIVEEHGDDPNFPPAVIAAARRYIEDDQLKENPEQYRKLYEELKVEAAMIKINSAYAEVRAVVSNRDEDVPAGTFRAWLIGTIFVAAGGFINQFFSIRFPGIGVGSNVAQVLAFPAAKALEYLLPTTQYTTFGYKWSFNPGPFNPKEHMIITIMANAGFSTPYTNSIIWVQYLPLYFNQSWATGFGYQIMVALSTNYIGYGIAGLCRRFLVYPASAIWYTNLSIIALNRAFHTEKETVANGWRISRLRWFLYCFCAMFVYFWFPDYIFQALSYFNWITWIDPTNVKLAAVTGAVSGLGLNPIPTFDWNQLVYAVDPLIFPFYSTVNTFLGTLITLPIILAIWFSNTWFTGYLPINSNHVYDNTGELYTVSRAVGNNTLFDAALYDDYSPAYLAAGNILLYGVFFAVYTATLSHAFLFHRREIWHGLRSVFSRKKTSELHTDIHVRLMMKYKEVPEWQYFMILVAAIALGAAGVGVYPTETTPAVVLYGVFLAFIFVIPIGIILSITNVQVTLNVLAELFGGLWFPGNAVAMNYFKSYGYVTTAHTLTFSQDLKLAHYMHIPPVITFWAQNWATLVSTFVCTAILNFQMTQIQGVCTPHQIDHFSCPGINTFFTASVLWGTLGPKRMFGAGGIYNGLIYCFLIGAVLPIPFYFLRRRFRVFEYFHLPVLLTGGLIWAPGSMANMWPAVPVAYFFNVFIRKRYLAWWSKYNYITTTAFSAAIAISAIVIFFALEWPGVTIDWIGNNRPFEGCDNDGCPLFPIPDSGTFGPVAGQFH